MAQGQQNLKLKVLTLITKLGDRDTYKTASEELNDIAHSLDSTTLPLFLSCILSANSNDKSLIRKHCITLLSTLSNLYTNSLSSSLPKIITFLLRRLRDRDSSIIRTQCITAISSLASQITKMPFSTAFLKPLSEAVFTEQDLNAQVGSCLCLAAAVDSAPLTVFPDLTDPGRLGKALVPRLERLLKSDGFKAKSAGLVVMGSVIGVGGLSGYGGMDNLVKCLIGFLSNEDWASRKAASEALERLAVVERDALTEFKCSSLKVFESRRFDKVKAVRDVMNQMIEAWKQVPDVSEEVSPPPRSQASSREDANDGRYPPRSKISCTGSSDAPQMRRKSTFASRTTPSSTMARKRDPLKSTEKKTSPATIGKMDWKKSMGLKVEIVAPFGGSLTGVNDNDLKEKNENLPERRFTKPEIKRALFSKNSDDKMLKCSGSKSGSRVAPCNGESPDLTAGVSNGTENHHSNHKECEDLSLIRNQLVQIERQQSSLQDLLQRFIGSSQNGMRSLETRVHGLELALDEISYDLAVSSGRMTNTDSCRISCCLLPGANFFSSRFWKKTEGRYSTSRFSSSGDPSSAAMRCRNGKNGNAEAFNLENGRLRLQGSGGFIVNPLAEIPGDSRGITDAAQH